MKEGGTLTYRCRACGKVYDSCHVPDVHRALSDITRDGRSDPEWLMFRSLVYVHTCADGEYGIADLIGGKCDR
jgi:uncharacterized Zn finger protein